jgi:hypothetical protein
MAGASSPRVELYVRSLTCRTGRIERLVESLHRLDSSGAIDDVSVDVWGEAVALSSPLTGTERAESILETVSAFRQWANRNGVSLTHTFDHERRTYTLVDHTVESVRLPTVVMAEYVDDTLTCVTPHLDGNVCRVSDRLAALASECRDPADDQPYRSA